MITVSLAGDVAEGSLRTIARDLKEDFRRIPGVAAVRIIGARERQIWVEVEPARLNQYAPSSINLSSLIPKWWAISWMTVLRTIPRSPAGSAVSISMGPRYRVIRSGKAVD